MSSSTRRFGREDGNGGRRVAPATGNGDGDGNGHVAVATLPTLMVLEAIEELEPSSRALLDLSLRMGVEDEQIAAIGQTDVEVLNETRDEAVRLVTAGVEIPPAEELAYVRRALALLYEESKPAEIAAPRPPIRERVDLDELEALLDLESAPDPQPIEAAPAPAPKPRRRIDLLFVAVLALAALVRLWHINKFGLNSDEAVYA